MHELTGDFYTVGQILGHSLKGIGIQLNMSNNLEAVTVGTRNPLQPQILIWPYHTQNTKNEYSRKLFVLNTYHKAVLGE